MCVPIYIYMYGNSLYFQTCVLRDLKAKMWTIRGCSGSNWTWQFQQIETCQLKCHMKRGVWYWQKWQLLFMCSFSVILDKVEIVAGHSYTVQERSSMKISGVVTLSKIMAPFQMLNSIENNPKLYRHNLWDLKSYNHACWETWHCKTTLSYLLKVRASGGGSWGLEESNDRCHLQEGYEGGSGDPLLSWWVSPHSPGRWWSK